MDPQTKKIILAVVICLVVVIVIIVTIIKSHKCKPHCDGSFCGPNSDDGCGGTCDCNEGGKCMVNKQGKHICCYSNCDGLKWGDDGCGGKCECDIIPGGIEKSDGSCCYALDCDNKVYCGPDGCGNTCKCQSGAKCSSDGICSNSGTPDWIWNINYSTGTARSNQKSPLDCAGWMPENVALNLTNFPCGKDSDCPYKNKCVKDPKTGKKFCSRDDVYQWWYYDPNDPSGYNCTKIRQGSDVCGMPKKGAAGFDITGNVGPNKSKCGGTCTVEPICPKTGKDSCCPEDWSLKGKTAQCIDKSGITQCCLNNPDLPFQSCISNGGKDCADVGKWWKANLGEIGNGICGNKVSGPQLHVNSVTLENPDWSTPCTEKNPGDECDGKVNNTTYQGICKSCTDGQTRCFPDTTCVQTNVSSSIPGICSSRNLCSN